MKHLAKSVEINSSNFLIGFWSDLDRTQKIYENDIGALQIQKKSPNRMFIFQYSDRNISVIVMNFFVYLSIVCFTLVQQ